MVALTIDLAQRVGISDSGLWTAWFEAMRELPGNPHGIEIKQVGRAILLHAHAMPTAYYNRVLDVGPDELHVLDEITGFYYERATPCRIDLNPFRCSDELLDGLVQSGFQPASLQTNLYGKASRRRSSQPGVRVRAVRADEVSFFADLYESAYHCGEPTRSRMARFRTDSIRARYGRPGWHFYLATVDGAPAGGGILFVQDGVASLAGGATVPKLRNRGVQGAVLGRRIADAAGLGCDLVVSRCGVGTISQRNLERAGLATAYTKIIWESRWSRASAARPERDARPPAARMESLLGS